MGYAVSFVFHGYRISRQIGLGAGSRIYLATAVATNTPVAIKRVVRNTPEDERFLQQMENEYKIVSELKSPYIRKVIEIHRVRKHLQLKELIMVMEYVDGLTVEEARPNRLNTFLVLMNHVAEGLHEMHEHGYVHTDIKPNNVMIARGGAVKIIDFGQSCPLGHRKERVQGTPDYIAPEQVRKMPLDRRTDVYNLGAMMYWLLTSERFPTVLNKNADAGQHVIVEDKPRSPVEVNDKIPRSLSSLVMECCSDNPDGRPADMMSVVGRLKAIRGQWRKQRASMIEKLRKQMG